jgi:hypothetical protein
MQFDNPGLCRCMPTTIQNPGGETAHAVDTAGRRLPSMPECFFFLADVRGMVTDVDRCGSEPDPVTVPLLPTPAQDRPPSVW